MSARRQSLAGLLRRLPEEPDTSIHDVSDDVARFVEQMRGGLPELIFDAILNRKSLADLADEIAREIYWPTEVEDEDAPEYVLKLSDDQRKMLSRIMGVVIWHVANTIDAGYDKPMGNEMERFVLAGGGPYRPEPATAPPPGRREG